MAATLHIADCITAIDGIAITDVIVCDLDEIPDEVDTRTAYLIPSPMEPGLISDFQLQRMTLGSLNNVAMNATYTLNYLLYYRPVGLGRGLRDIYPGFVETIEDTLEAILATADLNGIECFTPRIGQIAQLNDGIGKPWYACMIHIDVTDFVQ